MSRAVTAGGRHDRKAGQSRLMSQFLGMGGKARGPEFGPRTQNRAQLLQARTGSAPRGRRIKDDAYIHDLTGILQ